MMLTLKHDSTEEVTQWVADHLPFVGQIGFGPSQTLGVYNEDEGLIAGIVYHRYVGHDIEMSIYTQTPKWCQRWILKEIFHYPFEQLGCIRVSATIAKSNIKARKLVERLNFQLEGIVRKGFQEEDACIYGLLKVDNKFKKPHKNQK